MARRHHRFGLLRVPEALCLSLRILVLLECGVEPASGIFARERAEARVHLPEIARVEGAYALLALDEHRKGRGLNAADRGEIEPAFLGVEGGHGARAVYSDQPVCLRAAARRVGEGKQFLVRAQGVEAITDGLWGHRLQPQALDGLLDPRIVDEIAEDEFAFASGVAGVDKRRDVFALHEAQKQIQAILASLDRRQFEVRRDHRQSCERPLTLLDVVLLRKR